MNPPPSVDRCAEGDVARTIRATLRASPFPPKAWSLVVVVLRLSEGQRGVMLRDTFAARLRANDLEALAVECLSRKVKPGEALVWCELDVEGLASAGFSVVQVGHR